MAWSLPGRPAEFGLGIVIETAINFSFGFLSAALLGLLIVPLVFKRLLLRSVDRIVASAPFPPAEMRADKDQLRAKLATSTRQLEMSLTEMKTRTMSKLAELEQKTGAIKQLKNEIDDKTGAIARLRSEIEDKVSTIVALEDRNTTLAERLRNAEEQFEIRGNTLRETEDLLADREADLAEARYRAWRACHDRRPARRGNRSAARAGRYDQGERDGLRERTERQGCYAC